MGLTPESPGGQAPLDRVLGWCRHLNRWLHWISGATVTGLMLLTVVNIVGRGFWGRPFRGTVELTEMAMIIIVYLGLAYAENQGDHIRVDLVHSRLRRTAQLASTVITSLFGVGVVGFLGYRLYQYALVLGAGDYTTSVRGIPMSPIAFIAVGGAVVFAIAHIDNAVSAGRRLREQRQ